MSNAEGSGTAKRVALITGGSGGIGAATALALARAGHLVGVGYAGGKDAAEKVAEQASSEGGTASAVQLNVTDQESVETAFKTVEDSYGPVEILVNAAGVTRDKLMMQLKDDDWAHTLDANLTGTFRTCRRALRPMVRGRFGRIVNVSSVAAVAGAPGQANYAASKAGLVGMTRALAREVGSRNITANTVEPGPIETPMFAALSEDRRNALAQATAIGRAGTPEEVAEVIAFLCSDSASYVTGAVLPVDGGLAMGR